MNRERPAVVVTGVSTGIGLAAARVLVARGAHVFGSVRRTADAERVAAEIGEQFSPLIFDITDEDAVRAGAALVRSRMDGRRLLGLVNNAGVAVPGPLIHLAVDDFRRQLETNVTGALIVTQAFAPLLGTDRALRGAPGRIVMVSSVAGRIAPPFIGAYAASKHALEGMSEALRRELMLYGIDVIIVAPGAVATPIWDKAEGADLSAFAQTEYAPVLGRVAAEMVRGGRRGLPAERVGETIWTALTARHPRARYAVVRTRLTDWLIPRALPRRLVDRIIARALGWKKGRQIVRASDSQKGR